MRITPPPKLSESISKATLASVDKTVMSSDRQARILTSTALFGVLAVILLHEFGHWLTGLIVTGQVPDFYIVAVRQKVESFSTVGGIVTWGSGPVVQLGVVWGMVLLATRQGRFRPRLLTMAGGAAIFSVALQLTTWVFAGISSSESWGNDLPKVATFFGSADRFWMHLLSGLFFTAILFATKRWWKTVRGLEHRSIHTASAFVGALEGGAFIVIATLFVELST